jgi:hypothetical protein
MKGKEKRGKNGDFSRKSKSNSLIIGLTNKEPPGSIGSKSKIGKRQREAKKRQFNNLGCWNHVL